MRSLQSGCSSTGRLGTVGRPANPTTRPAPSRGRGHPTGRPPCGRGATPQRCTTRCASTVRGQGATRRTASHTRRPYEAHHRWFTHVHRLSAACARCWRRIATASRRSSRVVRGALTQLGKRWAWSKQVPWKGFKADWERFGKLAGVRRNHQMAQAGDVLARVLGRPIARHRAPDPVHAGAWQTGGGRQHRHHRVKNESWARVQLPPPSQRASRRLNRSSHQPPYTRRE